MKFNILSLIAAALVAMPVLTLAQDTANAPTGGSSTNATAVVKKKHGVPFHGKIATIDASAGTFTVGDLALSVTSTTKISTNGVSATLGDFKVGDSVSGSYKKAADGTLNVTTLHLGGGKKKAVTPPTQ